MSGDRWHHVLKRFVARDWSAIADAWPEYLPGRIVAHSRPAPFREECGLLVAVDMIPSADGNVADVSLPGDVVASLRRALAVNALTLAHRSATVLAAAQAHADAGLFSWSISAWYQSGYFACRAIMALLGASFVEIHNRNIALDCWVATSDRRRSKMATEPPFGGCVIRAFRPEHHQTWAAFQRLLRMTEGLPMTSNARAVLLGLDGTDFARQRNRAHYDVSGGWLAEITTSEVPRPLRPGATDLDCELDDPDSRRFSAILAMEIIAALRRMLAEVDGPALGHDRWLLDQWLSADMNAMFDAIYSAETR